MKKKFTILTALSLTLACSLLFAPNFGAQDNQLALSQATKIKVNTDDPRG
ncbi:hypothetical protein NDK47_26980 [Brevibacillus ruminantium]|uniref:Uncharacterized protein n=1 Tax=Brevibacillus ruminantium TaxID=2950604 RepID=A0ABY4WG52_9BACL|nr:hypothetical protein [Brevibacillus ruminantium]USG65699.1 hypothetical protein NDK47_26980 [Brevibacillus ruminantium]